MELAEFYQGTFEELMECERDIARNRSAVARLNDEMVTLEAHKAFIRNKIKEANR